MEPKKKGTTGGSQSIKWLREAARLNDATLVKRIKHTMEVQRWSAQSRFGYLSEKDFDGKELGDMLDDIARLEDFLEDQLNQIDRLLDIVQAVGTGRLRAHQAKLHKASHSKRNVFYYQRKASTSSFIDSERVSREKLRYMITAKGVLFGSRKFTKEIVDILKALMASRELMTRKRASIREQVIHLRDSMTKHLMKTAMAVADLTERMDFNPTSYRLGKAGRLTEDNYHARATEWRKARLEAGEIETIAVSTRRRKKLRMGAKTQ